jgi:hypothetical protein
MVSVVTNVGVVAAPFILLRLPVRVASDGATGGDGAQGVAIALLDCIVSDDAKGCEHEQGGVIAALHALPDCAYSGMISDVVTIDCLVLGVA